MNAPLAERAVVGAALAAPDRTADLLARLAPGDFADPVCRALWERIASLDAEGNRPDVAAVAQKLPPGLDHSTLIEIMQTGEPAHVDYHAGLVVEASARRRVKAAGDRLRQLADSDADSEDILDAARRELDSALPDPHRGTPIADLLTEVMDRAEHGEAAPLITTGLIDLDYLVAIRPGHLVVIGARPGVGKSTLALQIAANAASSGQKVVFCSLEMSAVELGQKLLAAHGRVPLAALTAGGMNDMLWSRTSKAVAELVDWPIIVDDDPSMHPAGVRAWAKRARPALIVVDYLQLLNAPKAENRQVAVAEMSRSLKLLAKQFECAVIACSQLKRPPPTSSGEHKPTLADLRESGALEQDADTVILLHRANTTEENAAEYHEATAVVAKQRSGPTGEAVLGFDGPRSRFVNLAMGEHGSAAVAAA